MAVLCLLREVVRNDVVVLMHADVVDLWGGSRSPV